MSVTVGSKPASLVDGGFPSRILKWMLWALVLAAGTYFVLKNVPRYFIWSEATYGFYWPRAGYLLPHVVGGLVAIVIGPFMWSRSPS